MIAITGANGHLGRAVLDHLLKAVQPSEIRAVVRQPEQLDDLKNTGIDIRAADYEHPDSLNEAFEEELAGFHLPEEVSALLISLAKGIGAGEYDFTDNTLELLLGRKPLSLPEYLKTL